MRILMVTSFPIPGDFDGTAMLPIKILRALKSRGVDVVLAHLRARPPWGNCQHCWQLFDLDDKNAAGATFMAAIL